MCRAILSAKSSKLIETVIRPTFQPPYQVYHSLEATSVYKLIYVADDDNTSTIFQIPCKFAVRYMPYQ